MSTEFQKKLEYVTGYKANRLKYANELLENPAFFSELVRLSFLISNKNAAKACWILELVCYQKLEWLQDHLDFFCANIKNATDESAIRALSKICMLVAISHFKKREIQLSESQLQQITECCFDWLLADTKVASKCYAIRTLHLLGNHFDWIHPELKIILEKEYAAHSSAYKAVSKEILKKIK